MTDDPSAPLFEMLDQFTAAARMEPGVRPANAPEDWTEQPCANPRCGRMVWGPTDMPMAAMVCSAECATALLSQIEARAEGAIDAAMHPSPEYLARVQQASAKTKDLTWLEYMKMCSRCNRVLDEQVEFFKGKERLIGYNHTAYDLRMLKETGTEHDPDPVDIDQTVLLQRCDFCNTDLPPKSECWVIPAEDFHAVGTHWSRGDWAACGPCIDLVIANKWGRLVNRVGGLYKQNNGQDQPPRAVLEEWYGRLRNATKGPPFLESEVDWT